MINASRFVEVDSNRDYVIPAIQLINTTSSYYKPAVHIGVGNKDSGTACFCGQHHKQDQSNWFEPDVGVAPDITCKGCLRTMHNIIQGNPDKTYKAITTALNQKVSDIKYHIKKKGTGVVSDCTPSEPEVYPRQLGEIEDFFPRILPTGSVLFACFKSTYNYKLEIVYSEATIHSSTLDSNGNSVPVCGESKVNCSVWTQAGSLDTTPNITCPKCVAIQRKRQVETEPRRDKSLAMRKILIAEERKRINKFYMEYKDVIDYVGKTHDEIPTKWKQLINDFRRSLNNLRIMESGILNII